MNLKRMIMSDRLFFPVWTTWLALVIPGCTSESGGRPGGSGGASGTETTSLTSGGATETSDSGTGGGSTTTSGTASSTTATAGSDTDSGGTTTVGSGTDGSTSGASEGPDPPRFDVGVPDAPPVEEDGCTKVDLLFVIDDSGTMYGEQAALVASFPGFVDDMRTQLMDVDGYHVGITTTDVFEAHAPPTCKVMGALVTQTVGAGTYSSEAVCDPYMEGGRYMTEVDDLATKFACAATVGISGDVTERPAEAMLGALSPALIGPGGCNEGFLRPDALLVVVIITDEDDNSEGTGAEWFAGVVAAKGGIETNVVMLSIIEGAAGVADCSYGPADQLEAMTNMFTHGFVGDICTPPYDPFFTNAISVIEGACDDFSPPS